MGALKFMGITGISVELVNKVTAGMDAFNRPIYKDAEPITVDDVLVGEPSADDVINALNLHGKHVKYTLAIPKGDTNTWEGKVIIWGKAYNIITTPTQGIEANIPLRWNKKVFVEEYTDGC